MGSDNPSGAENQQETKGCFLNSMWVAGLVDGEGCFSVSIHRNPHVRRTRGWQITAVFQVSQHERYRQVLECLVDVFGCGRVRSKGPNSSVDVYSVTSLEQLERNVIPFFERHRLVVKGPDFERFATIVRSMRRKEHLDPEGFERIVRLAYEMNAGGKQRSRTLEEVLEGSSETVRQAPHQRR